MPNKSNLAFLKELACKIVTLVEQSYTSWHYSSNLAVTVDFGISLAVNEWFYRRWCWWEFGIFFCL